MEFQEFPKLYRLFREIIITEKIDGTNSQVAIYLHDFDHRELLPSEFPVAVDGVQMIVRAGSRNRWLSVYEDNFGFAAWVRDNAQELAKLGPGRHFGEWWGSGIQRRYGLTEKRFSLFNTTRWCAHDETPRVYATENPLTSHTQTNVPACCHVVPELYRGVFSEGVIHACLNALQEQGSAASPGFAKPEGIVVYHSPSNSGFKITLENDGLPKSKVKA